MTLQVGFQPPFAADFRAAHDAVDRRSRSAPPQLMRSLTRDPGLANPAGVPPWTMFLQTLIHDFDTLLWLNPGAEPVEVYATADALVAPDFKEAGLLDTAVVLITFDNGARAVAEASFSATYGYDVRGEVFGSAGMVTAGDGRPYVDGASQRHRRASRHRPRGRRAAGRVVRGRVRRVRRAPSARAASRTSPATTLVAPWPWRWPASSRSRPHAPRPAGHHEPVERVRWQPASPSPPAPR